MTEGSVLRDGIAREVRAEMARQNKTQQFLADLLGIPQPSVSLRLQGERAFRAEEIAKIADALGVPSTQFLSPQVASHPTPTHPRPTGPTKPLPPTQPKPSNPPTRATEENGEAA